MADCAVPETPQGPDATEAAELPRVFISYASQDADAAMRIRDALREAGLEVWFDQSELRGGDAWDASIRSRIKECTLFVPIISASTNARSEGYFRLEWKLAVDRTFLIADDQPFLLPVVIDDTPNATARVPDRFRERQWSRVTDAGSAKAFAARVAHLDHGPAPTGPVPRTASAQTSVASRHAVVNRPRRFLAAAAIVLLAAAIVAGWVVVERSRKAAFVAQSLPQIESLSRQSKFFAAFQVAREVERAGGADQLTDILKEEYSSQVDVQSTPPGALISVRPYSTSASEESWLELGSAPLKKIRVPQGAVEWHATLPEHATLTQMGITYSGKQMSFTYLPVDAKDATMVPVSGGKMNIGGLAGLLLTRGVKLEPYLIDRTEVTNREYAQFVHDGGYSREEYWGEAFRDGARSLSFQEAMRRFKDATGRVGPATWKLGNYGDGEDDLPVRGVSWYEAAAYARYAGKELPTLYHWYFADTGGDLGELAGVLLPAANFRSAGPRPGSTSRAVGAFGAVNMAGNVREWISNATDKQHRMTVGGSWLDPPYLYSDPAMQSSFDRPLDAGFRCMKRLASVATSDDADAVIMEAPRADATQPKPVSDAEYAIYARLFERRQLPLEPRIESTDDTSPHWTRHLVSYTAGYGGERLNALLYLPKNAKPPFQTIVFMPGSYAFYNKHALDDAEAMDGLSITKLLVLGGRAALFPVWKGMYERSDSYESSQAYFREHVYQWVSDLRQSVEFLYSRPDIDRDRIGFFGESFGAEWGPLLLALEPRIKTGVLMSGGLVGPIQSREILSPEINPATFAPHVRVPVLMINGRDDVLFIYETAQVPLFNLLGSPANKKKHKTYPGSHSVFGSYDELVRDTHDWLDEQFGPITPPGQK